MSTDIEQQEPANRRDRKRLATRQAISNAATRLFVARGFDAVTIDEIAAAADVGRMTVFNHFARKEDLFFDRDDAVRARIVGALRSIEPGVTPVDALRRLARRFVDGGSPWLEFSDDSRRFVDTIAESGALQARARAIRDEIAALVAAELAAGAGRAPGDADACLAAGLLAAAWSVALVRAHAAFRAGSGAAGAHAVFLDLVEKGSAGVVAALAGTPYA